MGVVVVIAVLVAVVSVPGTWYNISRSGTTLARRLMITRDDM